MTDMHESRLRFTFTTRNGKRQFVRMYDILISALDLSFTVYDIHAKISSLMPESSVTIISFPIIGGTVNLNLPFTIDVNVFKSSQPSSVDTNDGTKN